MKTVELSKWNRKQHYEHFSAMADPHFSVTLKFDVTEAYQQSKLSGTSFFVRYLHDCMKGINRTENLKLRVMDDEIVMFDTIHASATILRPDKTFGCSFIRFDEDIQVFLENYLNEKERIYNSDDLFPPENNLNCIHCSALPWLNFQAHKEPDSGLGDSIPKISFSKTYEESNKLKMNVAISVNHALVDGYHLGLFAEHFQNALNCND